jgi:hypothetical protein
LGGTFNFFLLLSILPLLYGSLVERKKRMSRNEGLSDSHTGNDEAGNDDEEIPPVRSTSTAASPDGRVIGQKEQMQSLTRLTAASSNSGDPQQPPVATSGVNEDLIVAELVPPEEHSGRVHQQRNRLLWALLIVLIVAVAIGGSCAAGACNGSQTTTSTVAVGPPAPTIAVTSAPSVKAPTDAQPSAPTNPASTNSSITSIPVKSPTRAPSMTIPTQGTPTRVPIANAPISVAARSVAVASYINNITLFSGGTIAYPPLDPANVTPEEFALQWLIDTDSLQLFVDTEQDTFRLRQRYALVTLLQSLWAGDASGIIIGGDECTWSVAIACDQENVTSIDLFDKNLTGRIPDDLGLLTDLNYFSVSSNLIVGTLPTSIGQLTSVETFSVWGNTLTGTIPETIVEWRNIKGAYFYNNSFTGSVPSGICSFIDVTAGDELNADCGIVACSCCTNCR